METKLETQKFASQNSLLATKKYSTRSLTRLTHSNTQKSQLLKAYESTIELPQIVQTFKVVLKKPVSTYTVKTPVPISTYSETVAKELQFQFTCVLVTQLQMVRLFMAKCYDLQIQTSSQQMTKFFEIFESKNKRAEQLDLSEMCIGDQSMQVVAEIIDSSAPISINLSKNNFTDLGVQRIVSALKSNQSLVHLDLSGNQITPEGVAVLFATLQGHQYITSLSLSNQDSLTHKIKLGSKGTRQLKQALSDNLCLISNLELTGAALTAQGHSNTAKAIKQCKSLISLNLAQNDFGSSLNTLLQTKSPLIELNLSNNNLDDTALDQIANFLKQNKLHDLDISKNCFTALGVSYILKSAQSLLKLSLDQNNLQKRAGNEFRLMNDAWTELLPKSNLKQLSLVDCRLDQQTWKALSQGLQQSKVIEVLSLRLNDYCDFSIPTSLQKLDLSQTNMTDSHLRSFVPRIQHLRHLNLSGNYFTNYAPLLSTISSTTTLVAVKTDSHKAEIEQLCNSNKLRQQQESTQASQHQLTQLRKRSTRFSSLNEITQQLSTNTHQLQSMWTYVHKSEATIELERSNSLQNQQQLRLQKQANLTHLTELDVKAHQLDSQLAQRIAELRVQQQQIITQIDLVKSKQRDLAADIQHVEISKVHSEAAKRRSDIKSKLMTQLDQVLAEQNKHKAVAACFATQIKRLTHEDSPLRKMKQYSQGGAPRHPKNK